MFQAGDRWRRRAWSLAVALTCLIDGNVCAAGDEAKEEIVVGSNHAHLAEILTVTVIGRVPGNGKKIGVTAKFSETVPAIDRLSIQSPEGRNIVVPRSYFEKVYLPQPRSLSIGYIMDGDSGNVGGILVFLDFGQQRRRADLKCTNDTGDPVFESFSLFYDIRARSFKTTFADHCGEPVAEK